MDQIEEFVDERQKAWCIHCGGWLQELDTDRDHVPSKSFLRKPYPDNLPVVRICKPCNKSFSLDEQYLVAFLGCVLAESTNPDDQDDPRITPLLSEDSKLRARIERARTQYKTLDGETRSVWTPEIDRINAVIVKNARGHAFFECGEPMLSEPDRVSFAPLATLSSQQTSAFENIDRGPIMGEMGSRMLTRLITGQDLSGDWVVVQDKVYRYAVAQHGGMLVRSVLFEYLGTEVHWCDGCC